MEISSLYKTQISCFVILAITLSSCSSLTKTQNRAIGQYFQTINQVYKYPEQANNSLATIKLNRIQLYPGSFENDSIMVESLTSSLKKFKHEISNLENIELITGELEKYINEYYLLIPNGFNALRLLESTSVTIAGFFGLNRVVSSAFSNVKTVKISSKKAKKVKSHIANGNQIVLTASAKLNEYIITEIKPKLAEENRMLRNNYKYFLSNQNENQNSYDYYTKYNALFIEQYKALLNAELLADKLLEVSNKMIESQNKIYQRTLHRQNLDKNIEEIQELSLLVNELNRIINQFAALS